MRTGPRSVGRALASVAVAAAAVAAAAGSAHAVPAGPTVATSVAKAHGWRTEKAHLNPFNTGVLAVMNKARRSHGLAPLRATKPLGSVASGWAVQLAGADQLSHNPRLVAKVSHVMPRWRRIEENVGAMGAGSAASVGDGEVLARAYLASPVHRANILNPRVQWVGLATASGHGAVWNAVDFVG